MARSRQKSNETTGNARREVCGEHPVGTGGQRPPAATATPVVDVGSGLGKRQRRRRRQHQVRLRTALRSSITRHDAMLGGAGHSSGLSSVAEDDVRMSMSAAAPALKPVG
mmetsp:Transcript_40113/g.74131  ORF Transcript_40113/g.74131 Transcript_40113/m.74131 type:complete len:110 (-) Transcript_40113:531-860(-)